MADRTAICPTCGQIIEIHYEGWAYDHEHNGDSCASNGAMILPNLGDEEQREEAIAADDQLAVVEQWLEYMKKCTAKESLSYGEVAEIQSVYDIVKENIY